MLLLILLTLIPFITACDQLNTSQLPIVAIANYGPHSSLDAAINGIQEELAKKGYVANKTVRYVIKDVGFDPHLIPQMLASLQAHHPRVLVTLTSPVSQMAKHQVKNTPIIFTAVTDPVAAGLLADKNLADKHITGSSDQQDLRAFMQFAKTLLPQATRIGLLYATSEANDHALVQMMQTAAQQENMQIVAIPVDQTRDVPSRITQFENHVDLIYVGASGPIQPTLPAIAAWANKAHIPVFNVNDTPVKEGIALASMGVDYEQVGKNAGQLVANILSGKNIESLPPMYPTPHDHHGVINAQLAKKFNLIVPQNSKTVSVL